MTAAVQVTGSFAAAVVVLVGGVSFAHESNRSIAAAEAGNFTADYSASTALIDSSLIAPSSSVPVTLTLWPMCAFAAA